MGGLTNDSETQDRSLTQSVSAAAILNGHAVTDLTAAASNSATYDLGPEESIPVDLEADDSASITITDPDDLAGFVGDGTQTYILDGDVGAGISGPPPYTSFGDANGTATIEIEYEHDPVPVECPDGATLISPVTEGDHDLTDGGMFSISELTATTFDWTSSDDAPIRQIDVFGEDSETPLASYDYNPDGSFDGQDLTVGAFLCIEQGEPVGEEPDCETDGFIHKIDDLTSEHPDQIEGAYDLPEGGTFTISNVTDEDEGAGQTRGRVMRSTSRLKRTARRAGGGGPRCPDHRRRRRRPGIGGDHVARERDLRSGRPG